MTTSQDRQPQEWGGRLSPADVHNVLFSRAGLGRRGYDELEVDVFLERVQQEITQLISEKADLRDEVSRLKHSLAQAGRPGQPDTGGLSKEEANLQAIRLIAAAQQTADAYVADAEKYSQRLTVDAREQSEQMMEEARQAAQRMLQDAKSAAGDAASRTVEGVTVGAPEPSKEELDQQIAYLKTFSQVCRVHLRAYLEALLRDVEEEWGRAAPDAALSIPAPTLPSELTARGATALPVGAPAEGEDERAAPQTPAAAAEDDVAADEVDLTAADEVDLTAAEVASNGQGPRHRAGATSHSR